jgi:uncharacterized Zn-finger protein
LTEREKVQEGLECHLKELTVGKTCFECPYCGDDPCEIHLITDVIALLEEQEAEPQTVLFRDDGEYCPYCSTITSRAMGVQKLHRGTRFCPYCGKAVTWNG